MSTPFQVIVVLPEAPDAASNKRVKGRPPSYEPSTRRDPWPVNQQPPDAEARRHLDAARREIANTRPEIERLLRSGAL